MAVEVLFGTLSVVDVVVVVVAVVEMLAEMVASK
jgi:hypothetical protein